MRLTMKVSLPQRPSSIGDARRILVGLLSVAGAADEARGQLAVLISEACANVVQHGDAGATIDLHIVIESGRCLVEVGNRGRVPDGGGLAPTFPDAAQPNGRGLALIAALSDSAQFVATTPGYVLLRMILHLHADTNGRVVDSCGP
jgi:serine/threonine-protein kinase RsbW